MSGFQFSPLDLTMNISLISDSFVFSVDFGRKPFVFSEDAQSFDCLPPLAASFLQSESLFVFDKRCTSSDVISINRFLGVLVASEKHSFLMN